MKHDGPIYGSGTMRQGRLRILQADALSAQIKTLRDGVVEFTIERRWITRRPEDNIHYWTRLVRPVAQARQLHPDDVHAILRAKFLPNRVVLVDGRGEVQAECVVGRSTKRLSPEAFAEFYQRAREWVIQDLGIDLPE